ncbi:hypothetical protein K0M31_008342 [Melipona bicolor]|uniref:Uncharacterized protein n=1 Tax=Melipona bicolor TaxID=60889 RepID=A0AA40FQT1_9HYME|nr:hypothetical protein K0M31_008342 [Melipona bicolor]
MKAESNNGYLKANVIVEQNEVSPGSGQEIPAASPLQTGDLLIRSGDLDCQFVGLMLFFFCEFGDLWAPWQHDDDDGPPASRKQPEENNARNVDQAEGGGQQAAIARCSRRHSSRQLPFHSAAAGVEHEPRIRARAPPERLHDGGMHQNR